MQKSSNSSKENSAACCQPSNSPANDSARILIEGNTEVIAQMNMINLTEEDLQLIAAFRPVIETEIEQITSSFYESILHVDSLKQIVMEHTTVERLRQTLKNHLIEMFDGRMDPAFIEKRMKIAMVHRKIGLPPKWYMGSFQNLLGTLMRIIDDRKDVYPDSKKLVHAITKLLSFDQQLVLEAYEDQTRMLEQRAKSMIEYQAFHDELTGLPNRRKLHQALQEAIGSNSEQGTRFAVLVLDIDRFKMINDSLGHTYGDRFLQEVSDRIKKSAEGFDVTIARMGGDEFTLICQNVEDDYEFSTLAERVVKEIEIPYLLQGKDYYVSASIGVAVYPDHGCSEEQLLKNADAAMYEVKKNGKNGFQFFTNELDDQVLMRIELERDLRKAVKNDELVLYYQPQIQTGINQLIGVEALVRWNHPTKGTLSPGVFIPIAEETGLIFEIGMWTLKEACKQMKKWHEAGGPLIPVSVNLSSRQFHQPNLVGYIRQILVETGLEPQYLELEITESMMMDAELSTEILKELHEYGVKISLDDFGTGYSSLSYLKLLPIHKLKIDRSFITDITMNPSDQAIVATIISMAKHLNMNVIAEGIETQGQLDFLTENACKEIQGYYFSHPLPAAEMEEALFMPVRERFDHPL
ncbi:MULTISPECIES: putative bifunctional diguanylate cyclase/phosphodiesterase [Brevibacillus]|uniref:putative bifunctional diguanylate cyclase/phosphodiesterase n=1 Tax=Brevibacillus TaxID=55080 RepID=UPI001E36629B|nr:MULTISPECIES: EAL domain-containing protein [Brevibacillus]MCE0448515.1 transglutaminase family protein [Brevibacillus sp. AF8]UKK98718.1 EAL domain-containing protein [Brevibacillus brevis]